MGCLKLERNTHLYIAHTSNSMRSGEGKYCAGAYKYKFQGQERQDELGLNWDSFKWRNYDYAIGRFMSVDPLAKDYPKWTPYAFSGNQVVAFNEIEGLEVTNDLNEVKILNIKSQNEEDTITREPLESLTGIIEPVGMVSSNTQPSTNFSFLSGVINAFGSNILAGAGRKGPDKSGTTDHDAYADGQDFGDALSALFGLGEIVGGVLGGAVSVIAEIPSGGTSTITLVASGELIAHGATVTSVSMANLMNGSGSSNGNSSSGKENPKKAARAAGKEKRAEQPGSEKRGKDSRKDLKKREGPEAARKAHDKKDPAGPPNRTPKQLKEDYGTKW